MAVDYSKLTTGQIVSQHTYQLDEDMVGEYVAAVQDGSDLTVSEDGRKLAPPMSMAALSLRGVVQDLQIPGGTLHVGQEFEFAIAVPVGTTLECEATLAQNSVRAGGNDAGVRGHAGSELGARRHEDHGRKFDCS